MLLCALALSKTRKSKLFLVSSCQPDSAGRGVFHPPEQAHIRCTLLEIETAGLYKQSKKSGFLSLHREWDKWY